MPLLFRGPKIRLEAPIASCILQGPGDWPLILPLHSRLYCHSRPLIEVNFQPAQLDVHRAEGMESTIDDEAGK